MAVTLPRVGRYQRSGTAHDWAEARRRLEAEPGQWVLPVDGEVSNGTVSWLRTRGPAVLFDIRDQVEFRIRETHAAEGTSTVLGTLYARYTPGVEAPALSRGNLAAHQIIAVREEYAAGGITQQVLADKYQVSASTINGIVRGLSHVHVGGPITRKKEEA